MPDDVFQELFAGAALAARYVAEPEAWEQFVWWCRQHGYLLDGEEMSRELMMQSSKSMWLLRREIEIQLLNEETGMSFNENETC